MLVENGHGLLGLEAPKSAVQEWIDEMSWFFSCWYKFRKANLGQSDYMILKSTTSLEQNDEKAWFFAWWYRFMENSIWLKNVGVGMVKNGCDHSVLRTVKFAVCQGKINEWNKLIFGVLIQLHES